MKYPLLALEKVASVTNELLILETEVDLLGISMPAVAFYAGSELNKDPTNWWAPNLKALRHLLQVAGFKRVKIVSGPAPFLKRFFRSLKGTLGKGNSFFESYKRDRVVVHAWKN